MREVYTDMTTNEIESQDLNGAYSEIASLLGVEAATILHSEYRGQQITFPVHFFTNEFIAEQVMNEYDGKNIKQLATKFGYSEKWIRKIIKQQKEKRGN